MTAIKTTAMRLRALTALLLGLAAPAAFAACRDMEFEATPYTVCEVSAAQDLRLFHADADGAVLGSFGRVDEVLAAEGKKRNLR